ncbi:autoinducer binding domain-containing protein [Celeribacter neptunius]|uniref:LuxR family transcriptional regulator n=1 Tax=Celeribacter neptunius TaxID=588602 RepID=A0A1I3RCP2_9RHOB|nr:autoinducer binding domain-containing protein [Celeribacter neptunius]SFJ44353.1 LuxR family transcriptional regulator [Celeribacter neptunius]
MSNTTELTRLFAQLRVAAPAGYSAGLHIRFASPIISEATYDPKWIQHYAVNAYALRDPMIAWGLSCEGAKRWSEIELPDPFNLWRQAAEFGLNYGVAVSCGPVQSRSIVGCARSDREFSDQEISKIATLVRTLHEISEPQTDLTQAQIQALRCIAGGDRHAAAAAKLGISESALKARLVSARERLMARTTSEAIQKAKEIKLL